jgi:DNA-binding HxlR family transcriptional regulator
VPKDAVDREEAHPSFASPDCRLIGEILSRVGDKWSVLIIISLGEGPKRFNGIKRAIHGISQRMLTLTLRGLERDGIVSREVVALTPLRVEYALTNLGRDLLGPVGALGAWARKHAPCIHSARAQFDRGNGH